MVAARRLRLSQWLLLGSALACGAASLCFGFLYVSLYWRYRELFNAEGRYFDAHSATVYHQQDGVLIVPALAFLLLALLLGFAWWLRRARPDRGRSA